MAFTRQRGGYRTQSRFAMILVGLLLATISSARAAGPDLIVGELGSVPFDDFLTFEPVDGIIAYAFSTEACNLGDAPVSWVTGGMAEQRNKHPIIAQNMFRLKAGRFEQIGQAWLKHGFCGTNEALCGVCPQENQTGCESLAVGCSDPYGAELNSAYPTFHLFLGPKSDVNAATGAFPYSDLGICEWCPLPTFSSIDRRLQVAIDDVDSAMNVGARYFIEGQYISPDESAAGNGGDNVSWREIVIDPTTLAASAAPGSMTHRQAPAIFAWRDADPTVLISEVVIPDDGGPGFDGRIWVAAKATDIGGGWWHYEYAVQNVTSDRSVWRFWMPVPDTTNVTNIEFHDVNNHSGERLDSTDWAHVRAGGSLAWSTSYYMEDEYANALRWGTLYNFRFDANVPPTDSGSIVLDLFKPGTLPNVSVSTIIPSLSQTCDCPGDVNGDELVNGEDVAPFVGMYIGQTPSNLCADVAAPADGVLDAADVESFAALLLNGGSCP